MFCCLFVVFAVSLIGLVVLLELWFSFSCVIWLGYLVRFDLVWLCCLAVCGYFDFYNVVDCLSCDWLVLNDVIWFVLFCLVWTCRVGYLDCLCLLGCIAVWLLLCSFDCWLSEGICIVWFVCVFWIGACNSVVLMLYFCVYGFDVCGLRLGVVVWVCVWALFVFWFGLVV